ncbi:MAG: hypothetical protein ACI9VO_000791 [Colwellia sp.]|jgi:uncharacterized protein YjeT (DUF2065 family)
MESSLLLLRRLFLMEEVLLRTLFPNRWRTYLLKFLERPIVSIRTMGIITALLDLPLLYICL